MNFDIEELRLIPEDFAHDLSLHILKSHSKKLEKRLKISKIIDKQNSIKGTQSQRIIHTEMRVKRIKDSIDSLLRDKEIRARRARMKIV